MKVISILFGSLIAFAFLINSGLCNVSASSENGSKSVSKDLDAPKIPKTDEKRARKESSIEEVTTHSSEEDYSGENSEDYSDDYDSSDETSEEESRRPRERVTELGKTRTAKVKPIKKAEKAVSEDYSDISDLDEYDSEDYDSSDSEAGPKKPGKPKKPRKTPKQKREKLKKERKRLERKQTISGNNLTSAERWENRLAKEERRKAYAEAHNETYVNRTKPRVFVDSSERWNAILAKEERTRAYCEVNNFTYVNASEGRMAEYRRKKVARIERERELIKNPPKEKKKRRDHVKKEMKKEAKRRRRIWRTESQEEIRNALEGSSSKEGSRRSRARARDARLYGDWDYRDDRRGGYRRGYDRYRPSRYDSRDREYRSRDSRYRGNDRRYDSSFEPPRRNLRDERYSRYRTHDDSWRLQLEKRPDRYDRFRPREDGDRRGPNRYDSNRGGGYRRGGYDRGYSRENDRGRGSRGGRYR